MGNFLVSVPNPSHGPFSVRAGFDTLDFLSRYTYFFPLHYETPASRLKDGSLTSQLPCGSKDNNLT